MGAQKYILAIDQGTTGTTVALVNHKGSVVLQVNKEFSQIFPKPGWVEHNPEEIWLSVVWGIKQVLKKSGILPQQIASIGITNQRETAVAFDGKTGRSLNNAIVWQCRRTEKFCDNLKKKKLEQLIYKKTGLTIDPYFSSSKINWLLKNSSKVKKNKNLKIGTIDSFLIYKLTAGESFKTDVSNASRTQLMNIDTLKWDKDLLKIFKVSKKVLPKITESTSLFGVTKGLKVLPSGIPITGVAGDQQAALFGQGAFLKGEAKCTYGTGSFILLNTGSKKVESKNKLLTTVAWKLKDEKKAVYALEGGAFICGASVQWLRDELNFFKSSDKIEALAKKSKSSDGVVFVPAFNGLSAPYWQSNVRGIFLGLTRGTSKSNIAYACLEALALQNVDILNAMEEDLGLSLKFLKVDGGASKNNLLLQMQANYLNKKIIRLKNVESTIKGAAFLSGLGSGYWKNLSEIKKFCKLDKVFVSKMPPSTRKTTLDRWKKAIKCAKVYHGN
ncbi:MAG: glycerol kinase GlpK [Bdellovibrionales bacterium]|nr:glycerol kinase GlpK [Bdellovibrionales bacterium]